MRAHGRSPPDTARRVYASKNPAKVTCKRKGTLNKEASAHERGAGAGAASRSGACEPRRPPAGGRRRTVRRGCGDAGGGAAQEGCRSAGETHFVGDRRWLGGITNSRGMSLAGLRELVMDTEAWRAAIHGSQSRTRRSDWTELN